MPQGRLWPAVGLLFALATATSTGAIQDAHGWRLTFDASSSGLADRGRLILGSDPGSLAEMDGLDEPHPPALVSRFVDVYTEHDQDEPGWAGQLRARTRYRTEFGPALGTSSRAIEFLVETDGQGAIDLAWDIAPDLDLAQHFLSLRDLETGAVLDMWEQRSYSFTPTGLRRRFRAEMVAGRSAPPVAFSQSATVAEDGIAAVTLRAEDPEADALTYEIVGAPAHGALIGNGANVTYRPAPDYFGPDAFTFLARDAQGPSNVATVSLTVTPINDPPSAIPQTLVTNEDEALSVSLAATDVDGDALTYSIAQSPAHGALEGVPPNLTYRPAANFGGTDSFLFVVSDGIIQSAPAAVTLVIKPVNDAPRALFTVPGEAANVAVWDNNLGSFQEGASITASSQTAGFPAQNAIDDNPATRWTSAAGQIAGASLTIALPHAQTYRVERIRLVNATATTESIKHFELAVSATSDDSTAFTTALSDMALSDGRVQEFALPLPRDARFVRLRAIDNYGSSSAVSVASFEVVGEDTGGLPSYASTPPNLAAAADGGRVVSVTSQSSVEAAGRAIDGVGSTQWTSAAGQRTNQALVVELAREKTYLIDRVRIVNGTTVSAQAMRNFTVSVSGTTLDPSAYVDVLTAVASSSPTLQEFVFPGGPVPARYVRVTATDNYGSSCCVSLGELQVVPAQSEAGSVSSGNAASERGENVLDSSVTTGWRTSVGQVSNQFLKIRLQAGRDHLIDRVRLLSNGGTASLKDFTVLVSSTTDADAAFAPVLASTLVNNALLQEFIFPGGPVRARYVKLLAQNNYGGTSILVSTFQVITAQTDGSVVSIPAPASQLARNESPAQSANGALVLAFSSAFDSSTTPAQMLDYVQDNPWATNGTTGQFALIRLARPSLLTAVRVSPRLLCCPDQSVKDFEVWTSDSTAEDAAFSKAFGGSVQNNDAVQTFALPAPVHARYVKYVPLRSYGTTPYISTTRFDVIAAGAGSVVGASSGPLGTLPELALDGNAATVWRTAAGAVTNQWITLALAGDVSHRIFGVRVSPDPGTGPKAFEVRVSDRTSADADFATVMSGVLTPTGVGQEFGFSPVDARYVQFRWLSGYGSSSIGVRDLEVLGGVASGALIRGASSVAPGTAASQALDLDTVNGGWSTASGQVTDQWLSLTLPGDEPIAIDRVALQGPGATTSPRDFEIQVSTTNTDPGAFVTSFAGTLRNDGTLQNYFFEAVPARHLRLMIRNNYGASSTTVQNFKVFSPEFGEVQARFDDQSTTIDGALTGRAWEFGDWGSSLHPDPAHVYPAAGTYAVHLNVSADTGLYGDITRAYRAKARPTSQFEFYPGNPREGQSAAFSDATDDPSSIVLREWDFGDGVRVATSASSVAHTYADNGTFAVSLRVTNASGLSAIATRQVLVTNVAPTVAAGPDRRWLAGESVPFAPTISDPGTDPPSCSWDFGDGGTSTLCAVTHTYLTPARPTDEPVVYTATLTVNDGDGGVTMDSVETTVFPQRMTILAAGLQNPIGIDWSPDLGRFVIANHYPNDQLVTVLPSGVLSPVLVSNLGSDEVNVVVSPGLGGFARRDVYYNLGQNRQVGRLRMDLAGQVTQVESAWVTQPNAVIYGGITFDTQGSFGNDLLVVWQNGVIYRVNSAGQSTEIGRVTNTVALEGATVAGPGLGPISGCLLTVARIPAKVWAICPNKTPVVVADMVGLTGNETSWIRYVPSPGSLVFTDFQFGRVLRGDSRAFGGNLAGHAVISTEYGGEVWDLSYDASSGTFQTRLMALAPNSATARLEDITWVPAHGLLAPATASAATGSAHRILATVKDEAGFAMAGLRVSFTVSGANPRSGEASTDDGGVATFEYVGLAAGQDTIMATSFGLVTEPVSVNWSGNMAPTAIALSLTAPWGVAVPIVLRGSDPEDSVLTYTIGTGPLHGSLSGAAPNLTYSPAPGYVGSDSFTFTVTDAVGAPSLPATVSIVVTPRNEAPSASAQSISTAEDESVSIALTGSDPENGALRFTIASPPLHGTLSGTAPDLTYSPVPDYNGSDSFTFTVEDPEGATSVPARVSIGVTPVNDPPIAFAQFLSLLEDTIAPITLQGVDPDGEGLSYAVVSPPQNGLLLGAAPNLTYRPNPNYNGMDSFAFVAVDPSGAISPPATIAMAVTFVNDAPVAESESTTTTEGLPVEITLGAHDIENDALTFNVLTPPLHGILTGSAPHLIYTPAAQYSGPDSLTFQATDAWGADSNVATISIDVKPANVSNQPPVCSTATGPRLVWPPNHEMTPLSILGVTDPEGGLITITVTRIRQDEPLNGIGDGDTWPDATLSPPAIRAERSQNGNGRVYTVDFKALDPLGASCVGVVKVCVPKSQSGKGSTCIDDGPSVDSGGRVQ